MNLRAREMAWWVLAIGLTYLVVVAAVVIAGTLYAVWAKRGKRGVKDDEQALVFGELQHSLFRRFLGLMIESAFQSVATSLQALHLLRLLPRLRPIVGGTPVLLLPGYGENAGCMWWLGRRLVSAGFNAILLDFPSTLHRIEDNATYLGQQIAAIRAQHGAEAVAIVAHSMGGLVSRTLVHSHEDHGVRALVAIASPFRGTHLAAVGARLRLGHSVHQMSPSHEYLVRYPPTLACPVPLLSLVARQETIVSPEWSVVITGAQVRVLDEPCGHVAPLFLASAFAEIGHFLLATGVIPAKNS